MSSVEQAQLWLDQKRYDRAEPELRKALVEEPSNPWAHMWLSLTLTELGRAKEAVREAEEAVRLGPDETGAHYVLGHALLDQDQYTRALSAASEAVCLDTQNPDNFALLSSVRLATGDWSLALQAAESGLALDAGHVVCANLRAASLVRMGRGDDAGPSLHSALAKDPENAFTHANIGWALLYDGKNREALDHFREALRLDPNQKWAREGTITALKARYPAYGLLLRWFMWLSTLGSTARWGVIIGMALGVPLARTLPPVMAVPATVIFYGFLGLKYTADPLSDLLLRFNRFGRMMLSPQDIVTSNIYGGCLGLSLIAFVVVTPISMAAGVVLGCSFVVLIFPLVQAFSCQRGWPRNLGVGFTSVVAALALASAGLQLAAGMGATGRDDIVRGAPGALFIATLVGSLLVGLMGKGLALLRPRV